MKISNIIPKSYLNKAKTSGTYLLGKTADALNSADEWAGEARDFVFAKLEEHPDIKEKLDAMLDRFRKRDTIKERLEAVERSRREARMTNQADKSPPPTAAEIAKREAEQGLGNSDIMAQIYGRSSCPWSGRAITLLEKQKIDYDFVDLDDTDEDGLVSKLVGETKQNTVPYIYLRGEFVGGFNALDEINRLGQLQEKIKPAPLRTSNVEVAKRANTDEVAPADIQSIH